MFSFLSFNFNAFNFVESAFFSGHQKDSEQLVFDGLIAARLKVDTSLGFFNQILPDTAVDTHFDNYQRQEPAFAVQERWRPYNSQYGLQFHALRLLDSFISLKSNTVAMIFSLATSLTLVFMYRSVLPLGDIWAKAFVLTLAVSPWFIVFARNSYWAVFLMLLPFAVSSWILKNKNILKIWKTLLALFLFASFLAKFLCGYEFMTSIGLSSVVPFFLYREKNLATKSECTRGVAVACLSFLCAFGSALYIHSASLTQNGDVLNGLETIRIIAAKRISNRYDPELARSFCEHLASKDGVEVCEKEYEKNFSSSLNANPISVFAAYLIVPCLFPYIPKTGFSLFYIQDYYEHSTFADFFVYAFPSIVSKSLFLFVCLAIVMLSFNRRKFRLSLACAFAASTSWFFLAKGHSYIHQHINYILWYLPFIPIAFATIAEDELPRLKQMIQFKKDSSS